MFNLVVVVVVVVVVVALIFAKLFTFRIRGDGGGRQQRREGTRRAGIRC